MLDFKEFLYQTDLAIMLEGVNDHQPKDGRWESPLDSGSGHLQKTYVFNVPGDDCGTANFPCYKVYVAGDPESRVSVSFSRDGNYHDQNIGVGMTVFRGVLKALGEYITTLHPAEIRWSAVDKITANPKTGKITNPNARADIYEGWATRYLFPDKYVGVDGLWVRRDKYDSHYVPQGFPKIPEEVSGDSPPGVKTAALKKMQELVTARQEEIRRAERERAEAEEQERLIANQQRLERERQEEEERRRIEREKLEAALQDAQKNPEGLKENDIVYVNKDTDEDISHISHHYLELPAKIEQFKFGSRYDEEDQNLHVQIRFASDEDNTEEFLGPEYWLDAQTLKKATPEHRAERIRQKEEEMARYVNNPETNPNKVQIGDEIITHIASNPNHNQNGLRGKITKFKISGDSLGAYVDWDEHAKEVIGYRHDSSVNVEHLRKATPEEITNIERARREHEIEQEVQANRERQTRRTTTQHEQPEEDDIEELINHTTNPLHLRPGDYVKVMGWQHRGRAGIILKLEKSYYADRVSAMIKFHGSRARPSRIWDLGDLERDDSPQAQAIQTRQQQQLARQQRIANATNGLQIGDNITVASGVHRGKTGRILTFRTSGQNISAMIAAHEGNFTVNIRSIAPNPQAVAAESLSFFRYYLDRE